MYGFLLRPKWIAFHLLVIAGVVAMVNLGFWQLRRLDERRDFNALAEQQLAQPPVPLEDLLDSAGSDPDALTRLEWRRVTVEGTWLDTQIIWFNRSQGGIAGDNVLGALVPDASAGTSIIVNRGFVPTGSTIPGPRSGHVELLGRVRLPQARRTGELTDTHDGPLTEVRRVDVGLIAEELPGDVPPLYLDVIDAVPALDAQDPTPTPEPTLDEGPHLSYAMQWFIFSACVVIGWVLAVRRSISTHRAAVRDRREQHPAPGTA